jgi:methyl-accepting chemotaxis protein
MSDYTNKELLEAIYEVRDRVTRIEESLKRTEKLEDKIDESFDKASEAQNLAKDAISLGQTNREMINVHTEAIKSIQSSNKWAWGLMITSIITLTGAVIGVYFGK